MSEEQPISGNLIIRASAGTGKTFQLAHRYLALLHGGAPPDRILASTFTRKAAGEITDRVVVRLAEAVVDAGVRRELAELINAPQLGQDACAELLRDLLSQLYRLRISTLDSLFMQMTRSLSLELGTLPHWRIINDLEDAAIRDQALEALFQNDSTANLLTLTHLLSKGEASRGIGDLVRDAINDMYELFLETEEKAWHALPKHKPLDGDGLSAALAELHGFEIKGKRFLKALEEDYLRALSGDWDAFISKGVGGKITAGETTYYGQEIPVALNDVYQPLLDHARALLVGRIAQQTAASYQLLAAFDGEYQRIKRQRQAMRFADVTWRLAHAALRAEHTSDADIRRLAFRLDGHIDHVLLDEFQDTSPPQWHAIRPLVQRVTSQPGNSFFCVGDVKQAIYGWRGGLAEIFDAVSEQLPGLGHKSLNTSYRSSQPVIDTVNRIFTGIDSHPNLDRAAPAVTSFVDRFETHRTALTSLPGYVCLATAPQAEEASATETRLDFAVERIARLHAASPGASLGVLVRTNATVAGIIGRLRQLGVLASEEGGNPLTDAAAVQVILSLLRMADHPGNRVARYHVATSPLAGILEAEDHGNQEVAIRVAGRVRGQLVEQGYGPAIAGWASVLGERLDARQRNRLEQLVELAFVYGADPTLRPTEFVSFVEQTKVSDPASANVRVMTIHQAKGLEFDIVVLPELGASLTGQPASFVARRSQTTEPADRVCRYVNDRTLNLFPRTVQDMFAAATHRRVSEALCLLYVAVTRARNALHMLIDPAAQNERSMPRTYAGLLRSALVGSERVEADQVIYAHGDPEWYRRVEAPAEPPGATATASPLPGQIRLAPAPGGQRHHLARSSPSTLEGGSRVRLDAWWRPQPRAALLQGTILHAFFEQVEWLEDGLPDRARLRSAADQAMRLDPAPTPLDVESLIDKFLATLQLAQAAELLRRENYLAALSSSILGDAGGEQAELNVDAQNERPFAIRDQNRIITGKIDRLVLVTRARQVVAAEVIDYKTDRISSPEQLVERVGHYRPQVAGYRQAVAAMTGLAESRIAARLWFVEAGEVRSL